MCFLLADPWGLALVSDLLRKPWKALSVEVGWGQLGGGRAQRSGANVEDC